jgi:hypothetical protein
MTNTVTHPVLFAAGVQNITDPIDPLDIVNAIIDDIEHTDTKPEVMQLLHTWRDAICHHLAEQFAIEAEARECAEGVAEPGPLDGPEPCGWFALCDQPAAGMVAHPALDSVPTCLRCATVHQLDLYEPTTERAVRWLHVQPGRYLLHFIGDDYMIERSPSHPGCLTYRVGSQMSWSGDQTWLPGAGGASRCHDLAQALSLLGGSENVSIWRGDWEDTYTLTNPAFLPLAHPTVVPL